FGCIVIPPNPGAGHELGMTDCSRMTDAKVSPERGFNGVDRRKNRPRNPIFLAVFLIYRQILGRDDPFPFGRQDPFSVIKGLLHLHRLLSAAEHAEQTRLKQEKEKGNGKEYKQGELNNEHPQFSPEEKSEDFGRSKQVTRGRLQ